MMDRHEHMWAHPHPWVYGADWWPGMLLSMLNTVLWIALFSVLAWALWKWISPYIMPLIGDIFGMPPAEPPALEILRQRYAAGEIDANTFEQMRERLEASYRHEERSGNSGFD